MHWIPTTQLLHLVALQVLQTEGVSLSAQKELLHPHLLLVTLLAQDTTRIPQGHPWSHLAIPRLTCPCTTRPTPILT